jgi:peroxiredoxin
VAQHLEALQSHKTQLVAVSFTPPSRVAAFLAAHPLPFPAVSDPQRKAYEMLSLGKTSWAKMLGLGVGFRFLKLMLKGWALEKPEPGEDLLQLGGDFVLDGDGRLVFAHRSQEPTDRPTIKALLEAVKRANGWTS